jgi:pimeloyl-ACP methyl ester carboxylesterase
MKRLLLPILGASLLLSACGTEDGGPGTISTTAPMEAKYDTTAGVIPFPNNLLIFGGPGPVDGTLDIAVADPTDITDPKVAMNTLDGFSTVAPITTTFGLPIDSATITATSVRVFQVLAGTIAQGYGVGAAAAELTPNVDYKALVSPSDPKILVIKPIKALKSNTNYMVVVTNALKATTGQAARASAFFTLLKGVDPLVDATGASQVPGRDDATAAKLEGLRQLTQAMLKAVGPSGLIPVSPTVAADDVAVAWSFKTQTISKVLTAIQAASATDPYASNAANFITFATTPSAATGGLGVSDFYSFAVDVAAAPGGSTALIDAYTASPANFDTIGSVVIGAVKLPYYLDAAANSHDPAPLLSAFQMDVATGLPMVKSVQTVPFLMTIPKGTAPAALGGKWPVVIFQHGFTVDKSVVFGIANTLSKGGFAVIAIDAVLHGSRRFNLDLLTQVTDANGRSQTTAAAPDGTPDSSGSHYLNLTSLLTSRDNIRQTVADLIHLTRLLEIQTMDVVNNTTGLPVLGGDGTPDLIVGAAPISYVGHSNGGILGGVFAGVEPTIKTFVLVNPGGDYAEILQNSLAYAPIVNKGLAAKGVQVGSADYNSFFVAAQTVVDDGDPLNYAAAAVAAGKNILLLKTKDDGVVPNLQTDELSMNLGLQQVALDVAGSVWPLGAVNGTATPQLPPLLPSGGFTGNGFTFFTQGTHSSILKPDPATLVGLDVITEMQSQVLYYLASGLQPVGATIYIGATPLPSGNITSTVVQ